jgi:hypothetical protein
VSAPTHPSSNPRDLSTLIALLRSSNQGLCLDAANEIDRLLRDNVDLMKACTARMYSTHEPSADAEKILEAYDACWIEDETGGHSRRTMDQLRDIGKRFNDARAAVLAAMRPAPPSTTRQDRRYVPGDYVHTEGKNAIALECPHVHVMYEDGTVERRPLHCTSRSTEEPRGVTIEMLTQARSKLSTAVPPREGYSQAYADQMRTALLRIAGWREIDRNSLGERLREIEEIALAALMPTVTKSAESSPQGVQHGLAHREDETGRYSVPGEGESL